MLHPTPTNRHSRESGNPRVGEETSATPLSRSEGGAGERSETAGDARRGRSRTARGGAAKEAKRTSAE